MDLYRDPVTGAEVVVAVHSTKLGRPYGGIRRIAGTVRDAVDDALRLSRAMSYKCAAAGMPNGGSKIVVIGDPADPRWDRDEYWRFLAAVIDDSGSITGPDMGFTLAQAARIAAHTKNIVGHEAATGETAGYGVFLAMGVCAGDLRGRRIAIQGAGQLGGALAECCATAGAELIVADVRPAALEALRARVKFEMARPEEIRSVPCDIFAPCARGGVLNPRTIAGLRCSVVCGGANNPLEDEERDAALLHARGILYAVDWIANAGGVLNGEEAFHARASGGAVRMSRLLPKVHRACRDGLAELLQEARTAGVNPVQAAYAKYTRMIGA